MNLIHLPEPALNFGEQLNYPVYDPIYGLRRLGPFDFTRNRTFNSMQVIAIGPASFQDLLKSFWANIEGGTQQGRYKYEGLIDLYRLDYVTSGTDLNYIEIDRFQGTLLERYLAAVDYARDYANFDLLLVVEPDLTTEDIYNSLKQTFIADNIANQYVEADTLRRLNEIPVLHNFALAAYAKIGGKPWSLSHPIIANSIVVGLSFHLLPRTQSSQGQCTIMGIGQIIDQYGFYIDMHLSSKNVSTDVLREFGREFHSLYIPQELMQELIKRLLQKFLSRPDLVLPEKLIFHKTTPYHPDEIAGLQAALEDLEVNIEYALLHIKEDTIHRVYREEDKEAVRGMFLTFRQNFPEAVLWTVGKVPFRFPQGGQWQYYDKSGTKLGTSDPIALYLDPASQYESFNLKVAAEQVLALTKMRWNTMELSIRLPASIYLARQAGNFTVRALNEQANVDFLSEIDAKHFL